MCSLWVSTDGFYCCGISILCLLIFQVNNAFIFMINSNQSGLPEWFSWSGRGGICPSRHCRWQCKIFVSGVNFSIFTHFLYFFLLKLLKLGEIDGVKFLTWKSGGVKLLTNLTSDTVLTNICQRSFVQIVCNHLLESPILVQINNHHLLPAD